VNSRLSRTNNQIPIVTIIFFGIAIITLLASSSVSISPLSSSCHVSFRFIPDFPKDLSNFPQQQRPTTNNKSSSIMSERDFHDDIIAPDFGSAFDDDSSSESSDGSYTEEEYQMGLDFWKQSGQSQSTYPYNPDGTWCLSPAIHDQIALVDQKDLPEDVKDIELERLVYLMECEIEANSPPGSAIDLAGAIDDGRFNPWDDRPAELTSAERVMIWKAKNPDMIAPYVPVIGEYKQDSSLCACDCDSGSGDYENPPSCRGKLCALEKEGSSVGQVVRAVNLAFAQLLDEAVIEWVKKRDAEAAMNGEMEGERVLGKEQVKEIAVEYVYSVILKSEKKESRQENGRKQEGRERARSL
jgi:hypothetical protein